MWSRHSRVDGFDWQFNNGFTQTMLTGPMKDHTTGLQLGNELIVSGVEQL